MTRVFALAAAILVAALGARAEAGAAAAGDVGASAFTSVAAQGFGSGIPDGFGISWNETIAAAGGRAQSAHEWPAPVWDPGFEGVTCPRSGCAATESHAFGALDVSAGTLRAYASASLLSGGVDVSNGASNTTVGGAVIEDTITLSEAATVVVRGRLTARAQANTNVPWFNVPDADLVARAGFGEGAESGQGFETQVTAHVGPCPDPANCEVGPLETFDEPFEVAVELPAGTTPFVAELEAKINLQVWGAENDQLHTFHGQSALLDSANSLEFVLVVPDGVTATSGSGLLPIVRVGGGGEEPPGGGDTTPPALVLPTDRTVEATSPSGAVVTFAASASDAVDPAPTLGCVPSSGATFPLGATTVTCTARDASGNAASGSFVVSVVDTKAPVLAIAKLGRRILVSSELFVGALAAYPSTASDLVDPAPAVSCNPAPGSWLPIGITTVRCTATDAAGNVSEATVEVLVVGPVQMLEQLLIRTGAGASDWRSALKLLTPLGVARLALEGRGDLKAADRALLAFLTEVGKQSTKGLSPELAAELTRRANEVRSAMFAATDAKLGSVIGIIRSSGSLLGEFGGAVNQLDRARAFLKLQSYAQAQASLADVVRFLDPIVAAGGFPGQVAKQLRLDVKAIMVGIDYEKAANGKS